ncbi:DUF1003 domain-containing protein [Hoeflea sp. G2-23]|uniref:DUF1003 domain-containing protein n=1 Tax=Hoeflea algicola TaxID=2983763 RepID=A0ABT3Z861_9HYPH|nr:DUF1003 domain-containing protein [Hoeflea algicola]MCY0147914.1 DUF1003 domain-containing protein [Hoeflea algicola]
MDHDVTKLAERLLQSGYDDLPQREQRVLRRIAKRAAISQNINETYRDSMTFGQRVADRVASFGGSWTFIISFLVLLVGWVCLNALLLSRTEVFDPYPFVFLNLILSMLAALQAPVIMMSQNRQSIKDRLAATHDYEVNLKAELEIMDLHEKLDQVRNFQLTQIMQGQDEQLTEIRRILSKLPAT